MSHPIAQLSKKTRKLTIGFVIDDSLDRPDGVQQYVLTVGEWMRNRGHSVHYLTSSTMRTDLENLHSLTDNVAVSFNGNHLRMPLIAPSERLKTLLASEEFDVLHIQMPYSPFLAHRIIRLAHKETAVVGTFHILPNSPLVALACRMLAAISSQSLARFDAVMSVSEAARVFARDTFRITSSVVPNSIDIRRFQSAEPFTTGERTKLNILFLGRLVSRKGCIRLLQAVKLLASSDTTPLFTVTICGRGPLEYSLKQYVEDNTLGSIVSFTGFVDEVEKPRYYASADITVFPSASGESFGIVLLEAMASGRSAVIAGDNPGYRSVLDRCPGDVLFNATDITAIARKIALLLEDKTKRTHISEWQRWYVSSFDIGQVGPKIEQVYQAALRQRQDVR